VGEQRVCERFGAASHATVRVVIERQSQTIAGRSLIQRGMSRRQRTAGASNS
jgi:hypothetical protein